MYLRLKPTGIGSVESDEATVILDEQAEQYFSTNPTGSLLWKKLKTGTTREELISTILDEFDDADPSRVAEDVDNFVSQLERFGLLEKPET